MLSRARAAFLAIATAAILAAPACRPKAIDAPYADGKAPTPAELLARAAPQLPAIQVGQAKVVANRALRGNLAFLAQAPARFRGTVGIAGNELVTLSYTEEGYALRYKLDAFPSGFYHGPPSSCAVEALLGVAIDETDLVALVLGGAPVIEGPHEIVQQRWDRVAGHESLEIANAQHVQALYFRPIEGEWRFVGGALWQRGGDGKKGKRLWTLEHENLAEVGDVVLPERTKIVAPGKRKDNLVTIIYKDRELHPAFAEQAPSSDDGGGKDDGAPTNEGGDWGGGEAGWETEGGEGGWESEGDTEASGAPPDAGAETPKPAPSNPGQAAAPGDAAAKPTAAPTIPKVFHIEPTGLADRGDLCR